MRCLLSCAPSGISTWRPFATGLEGGYAGRGVGGLGGGSSSGHSAAVAAQAWRSPSALLLECFNLGGGASMLKHAAGGDGSGARGGGGVGAGAKHVRESPTRLVDLMKPADA